MGVVAAIASVFSAIGFSAATATGIAKAIVGTALSIGTSLAQKKFFGPKPPSQKQGRSGNLRTGTMPHHIVLGVVRKGGLIAYANGSGPSNNNKWLYLVVVVAAHEVESMDKLFVGGTETDFDDLDNGNAVGRLHDYAFFKFHRGTATQAADAVLVAANTNWTTAHQFKGRAYVRAELRESPARFPAFIPNLTVEMHGANSIFDPRDDSTGYTANPCLQIAWILETYLKVPRARIDEATLETNADVCEEQVQIKDLSFVNRYESHGFFELEGEPEDWISPITDAMAGAVVEHYGTFYIHAGAYTAPVVTITDDHIIGDIQFSTARNNLERPNTIKGVFVSPETYDAPAQYVPVTDSTFLTEDENVENVRELDLEFAATHEQARRVASAHLRYDRLDATLQIDVNLLIGLDVKPWDTVTVDSDVVGISDTYRITDHQLIVEPENHIAYVRLELHQIASSVYDWTPATQEVDLVLNAPDEVPDEPVETTPSVVIGSGNPNNDDEQVASIYLDGQSAGSEGGRGAFRVWKKVEKPS